MNRRHAHELLDAAKSGMNIPMAKIMQALQATGDLNLRHDKRELTLRAARTLLDHHEAGRNCDPYAIDWALQIIAANGEPKSEREGGPA